MRKKFWLIILAVVFTLCMISIVACAEDTGNDGKNETDTVPSITLSATEYTLQEDDDFVLVAYLTDVEGAVTWQSSDESVATVSSEGNIAGYVIGISGGSAVITASAGTGEDAVTASCTVTVQSAGHMPVLQLAYPEIAIPKNSTFNVGATVMYKNQSVEAVITAESDNPSVATVAMNNTGTAVGITGVTDGLATVTVNAQYGSQTLTGKIGVTVRTDIRVSFANSDLKVIDGAYSISMPYAEKGADGKYALNKEDLGFTLIVEGEDLSDTATWEVSATGTTPVTVEAGVLTATAIGTGTVTVSYIGAAEDPVEIPISVTVEKVTEYINLTDAIEMKEVSGDPVISQPALFTAGAISEVLSGEENITISAQDASEGTLTLARSDVEALNYGHIELNIEAELASFGVSATLVDKMIYNKGDLDSLNEVAKVSGTRYWDGYYMLGADINYGGTFAGIAPFGSEGSGDSVTNSGWRGTFDGDGHIISNITIGDGEKTRVGFFGRLGEGAIVKNVAFVHVTLNYVKSDYNFSGFLAAHAAGCTVENVFISGVIPADYNTGGNKSLTFGLANWAASPVTMRNVMAVLEKVPSPETWHTTSAKAMLIGSNASAITFENCIMVDWKDFTNSAYGPTTVPSGIHQVRSAVGTNLSAEKLGASEKIDFSTFSSDYWEEQASGSFTIFVFKNALPYIDFSTGGIYGGPSATK